MTFDEYQREAMRTKNRGELESVLAPHLAVAGLGLAGEAGEVTDEIKKIVGHGKAMDKAKLLKELGDVLWYAASLADELGVRLADVAQANIDKLKARYPDGFSTAASVAKADEHIGKGTTTHDWLRHMAEKEDGRCVTVGHIDKVRAVADAEKSGQLAGTNSMTMQQMATDMATTGGLIDRRPVAQHHAGIHLVADIKRRILAGESVTFSVGECAKGCECEPGVLTDGQ